MAAVCGDGLIGPGEDCDDGGTADGDCCSSSCLFETAGSNCDDGDICTDSDVCDGAGICAGDPNALCGAPVVPATPAWGPAALLVALAFAGLFLVRRRSSPSQP